jgi:hypothetical protein
MVEAVALDLLVEDRIPAKMVVPHVLQANPATVLQVEMVSERLGLQANWGVAVRHAALRMAVVAKMGELLNCQKSVVYVPQVLYRKQHEIQDSSQSESLVETLTTVTQTRVQH